ncbi:glucose-6-phosphate isomerase [Gammaproteobacteria bacterium AS21]
MYSFSHSKSYRKLKQLALNSERDRIADYFKSDSERFINMSAKANSILIDYSKNKITEPVLKELLLLADESELQQKISLMYSGDHVNCTEGRPALHTALRRELSESLNVAGQDVMHDVSKALAHIEAFCDQVRGGTWLGYNGNRIKNIVNIGIGGSDLGPSMVCQALCEYQTSELDVYFVSNVDALDLNQVLVRLKPEETMFIVSSKSFATQETMLNAHSAKQWFVDNTAYKESYIAKHFVAVTTNIAAAQDFGIALENIFEFWDWVGGRYSLWSSTGLPIALSIGFCAFSELLAGARSMDEHFLNTPFSKNLPVLLALIGVWHINFQGSNAHAVIPYNQCLNQLPAFLQQLDMESNGKSVDVEGRYIDYDTAPIVWGQTGANGQHAFFQLLHQGSQNVPVDFIASIKHNIHTASHNKALLTNMFSQAQALMLGCNDAEYSYKVCLGNKSSNMILLDDISPTSIGSLIALYEHKVFTQGVIWNINSFDQWGVELGKALALRMNSAEFEHVEHDASTQALLDLINM